MPLPENFIILDLLPTNLNRNKSQQALLPNEARLLQSVDVLWMDGRARRGAGYVRTNMPSDTYSWLNGFVLTRQDCTMGIIYHTGAGNSIKVVMGDGSYPCRGPVPFYQDVPTTPQIVANGGTGQSYDEERISDVTSDY